MHDPDASQTLAPPTEEQFNNLVAFLLSPTVDTDPSHYPFPIYITEDNKWRWDAYEGMAEYNIFKFRHEIRDPPRRSLRRHHAKCVISVRDWPEYWEVSTIRQQGAKPSRGEARDEALVAACRERLKRIITPTTACGEWDDEEQSRLQPDPKKRGRPPYFFER